MRYNWSLKRYWLGVRDVQIASAEALERGFFSNRKVSWEELEDLRKGRDDISVARILNLEQEVGHDNIAGSIHFAESSPVGGRVIGNGLTSEDTFSNVEMMQIRDGFQILRPKLVEAIKAIGSQVERHKNLVCMGYTHLQAAEPTTMGYRFARYAQNLLRNLRQMDTTFPELKGKGIKGPVGTRASFESILKGSDMSAEEYDREVMKRLSLKDIIIADQTYPRSLLFDTMKVLAGIGLSLHHAALEIQILQSSNFDEVSEPRKTLQPGSAGMPHKQNPMNSEGIDAVTELLPGHLISAWMVGAFQTLERTLRDSGGKRVFLPESFLIVDEVLMRARGLFAGLRVHENMVGTNLAKHAPFCATEAILGKLVEAGATRIKAHEWLVGHSEQAKEAVRAGKPNPMKKLVLADERIVGLLGRRTVGKAFADVYRHVGDAPKRCVDFLVNELYPAIRYPAIEQ